MSDESNKIREFRDLVAWQRSQELVKEVYKITNCFPTTEKFGLISQLCRAAISVSSNIAEGFSRKTRNEKVHFYFIALGSISEIKSQVSNSTVIGLMSEKDCEEITILASTCEKLVHGLVKTAHSKSRQYA